MNRPERQPQARSIATRERLVETTLETIYQVGLKKASTNDFSRGAGVSRGALLHHFPTRDDFSIAAAMETMLTEGTDEIREAAARVGRDELSLEEFIDFLWCKFSGRFFYLSIEFINGARTDPALREKMLPVVKRFHETLDEIWMENYGFGEMGRNEARVLLNLTLCLLRGMGLQTVLKDDPEYFVTLLESWKRLLPRIAADIGRGPSPASGGVTGG